MRADGQPLYRANRRPASPPAKNGRTGRPYYLARALRRAKPSRDPLNILYTVELVECLHGSQEFREVCGFGDDVLSESTFSRFLRRLERYQALASDCLNRLTDALREHIPDLGESVAIHSTSIEAFANPNRKIAIDKDAKWGVRHSSRSKDSDGTENFFGYKMHTLADADHGVPLGFIVAPGNVNDGQVFTPVINKAMDNLAWLKPNYVIADRRYDYKKCYQAAEERGIVPIIHIRDTKGKNSSPVYDPVAGDPTCLGKKPMEYVRTDPETGHHLFRRAKGGCHLKPKSNGAWRYCDTDVWEDPMENLRIVGIVARQSPEWSWHYKKRQSVERLFSGLKRCKRRR